MMWDMQNLSPFLKKKERPEQNRQNSSIRPFPAYAEPMQYMYAEKYVMDADEYD